MYLVKKNLPLSCVYTNFTGSSLSKSMIPLYHDISSFLSFQLYTLCSCKLIESEKKFLLTVLLLHYLHSNRQLHFFFIFVNNLSSRISVLSHSYTNAYVTCVRKHRTQYYLYSRWLLLLCISTLILCLLYIFRLSSLHTSQVTIFPYSLCMDNITKNRFFRL